MTYTYVIANRSFAHETCCNCGVEFLMPEPIYKRARADATHWFYCPNGHKQHYSESEADKLRRERDRLQQQMARIEDERREAEERARKAEATAKRLKKRAAAGTCPCCKRTVHQLAQHMATKHPGFVKGHGANVVDMRVA